jgi:2-polyprenyl-3-methyl-5-hydroxy-6-metoxy-1,4-benzoquinol methylase
MLIRKLTRLFGVRKAKKMGLSTVPSQKTALTTGPGDNPFAVSLLDRVADGWFNQKDSEICPGVKIHPHHTVADIGCGGGGIVNFCIQRDAHIMFMDVDAEKVNTIEKRLLTRKQNKFDALIGDCTNIPIDDDRCDIVICTEVLEHVDDPVKVMQELARIGKPGAYYVLTVPDAAGESLMKATAPAAYFEKPNHIRIFERDEFQLLVENAGLEVTKRSFHGSYGSILWMMHWMTHSTDEPMGPPWEPMSLHWSKVWAEILSHPNGKAIKSALDAAIPKCQVIVARKAET